MPNRYKHWGFVAAMFLVVGMAAWPLLAGGGLLNTRGGGNSPFLLQRVHQLVTAVSDGHFPVRWMPDANYGYGYPFFNFYAPLSIYIAAGFRFLGFGYVQAIQLAQVAGFVVATWGMFALARRWFGDLWTAVLAAIAYTVAPFHMVNVYVRGDSLAEFWAMAFYPWVILAADGLFDVSGVRCQVSGVKGEFATCNLQLATRKKMALFAVAYAALILSHNISALIFTPFLLLYLLIRWVDVVRRTRKSGQPEGHLEEKENRGGAEGAEERRLVWRPVWVLALAGLLAVGLSAFFVVPALAEKDYTQLGSVTAGYFHFSNHFLGTAVNPAVQSSFLFDYNPGGLVAFRMGLVQAVTIGVGVVVLLLARRLGSLVRPYRVVFILVGLALSTFMFLPLSTWFWKHLPLLDFTQFPWRFLSVQAFWGSLAVGAVGLLPWRRVLVPGTAVLLVIAALGNLHPDYLPLSDADVTPERLAQYEWFTGNIGTTIRYEYLPPTVQPRPFTSAWLNGNGRNAVRTLNRHLVQAELLAAKTTVQNWQIETDAPDTLILPTLYWRGWQGQIDGEPVSLTPADGSGLISLEVPAGVHEIRLQLKRTPLRLVTELVSLTAVLVVIGLFLSGFSPSPPAQNVRRPHPSKGEGAASLPLQGGGLGWGFTLAIFAGLLFLIIVAQLWPQPAYSQNDLTWDFAQMGYLHHDVDGVPFDNGLVLDHYEYSSDAVRGSETLTIDVHWQDAVPAEVTLALFSPAVHREQPEVPAVAMDTQMVNDRTTTFQLPIPVTAPGGLFVPRLLVDGVTALTSSGQSRGPIFLRPVLITDTAVPFQRTPQLDVAAADVVQRDDNTLDIKLVWRTDAQISPNYNVNLRLTDAQGQFLQLVDVQPGYGFQPSSLWPPGYWVPDWLAMSLPEGNHAFPYILVATLYDVRDPDTAVLTRKLGELQPGQKGLTFVLPEPVFDLPSDVELETAVFGDSIQLPGYKFNQTDTEIDITLFWRAQSEIETAYTRFVHLIPADTNQPPVAQNDSLPQFGTYPTSQWQAGEIVADRIRLSTADLLPGNYQLAVGFYEKANDGTFPRLTAVKNGDVLENGHFLLPITIVIE